jgi:hypothetical protein
MNASKQIDKKIVEISDWRGRMMARLRKVINDAGSPARIPDRPTIVVLAETI